MTSEAANGTALRGVGIILSASVLFGAMAVCVRIAAASVPALQIAFIRFLGSLVVLLVVTGRDSLRPRSRSLPWLVLRGALGGGAIILYYFAIQEAGAGLATVLHCTYPISTAMIAVSLMGEEFSRRTAAALILNLAGIAIIVGTGAQLGPRVTAGAVCAIIASVLAGGAVATARHLRASENASVITTYFMAVGTAMTTPALFMGMPHLPAPVILALAGVALSSVGGQWLLHHGLGFTSATQGSLAAATTVVSAAGLSALFLGERLHGAVLFGACLTISAVGLAAAPSKSPVPAEDLIAPDPVL